MPTKNQQKKTLSAYDKFGIVTSMIGLVADFIALGTFGYSLINQNTVANKPSVTVILWIGILLILPLIYSWGFLAWLANVKYGKPHLSVFLTGIGVLPLFEFWGILVLAEVFPSPYFNDGFLFHRIDNVSRTLGGLAVLAIQFGLGLILFFVLLLWNKLSGTIPVKSKKS